MSQPPAQNRQARSRNPDTRKKPRQRKPRKPDWDVREEPEIVTNYRSKDRVLIKPESPVRYVTYTNPQGNTNPMGFTRGEAVQMRRMLAQASSLADQRAIIQSRQAHASSYEDSDMASYLFSTKEVKVTKTPCEMPLDMPMSSNLLVPAETETMLAFLDPALPHHGLQVYKWDVPTLSWFLHAVLYAPMDPTRFGNSMRPNIARVAVKSTTISSTNTVLSGTARAILLYTTHPVLYNADEMYTRSTDDQRTELIALTTGATVVSPYLLQDTPTIRIGNEAGYDSKFSAFDYTESINLLNVSSSTGNSILTSIVSSDNGQIAASVLFTTLPGNDPDSNGWPGSTIDGYSGDFQMELLFKGSLSNNLTPIALLEPVSMKAYIHTLTVNGGSSVIPCITHGNNIGTGAASGYITFAFATLENIQIPPGSVVRYINVQIWASNWVDPTEYLFDTATIRVSTIGRNDQIKPFPCVLIQGVQEGQQLSFSTYASVGVMLEEQIPNAAAMATTTSDIRANLALRDYITAGGKLVCAGSSHSTPHAYSFNNFVKDTTNAYNTGKTIYRVGKPVFDKLKPIVRDAMGTYM